MGHFHFLDDLKDVLANQHVATPILGKEPEPSFPSTPALLNSLDSFDNIEFVNPNEALEEYTRRTAEAAEDINAQCAALRHDLDAERTERRSADVENLQYAEKWNRRNLIISLLALIVGIAALLVAVLDALGLTAF